MKHKTKAEAPRWDYKEGCLYLGDCLEVMKALPDDCCDLIIGSPPYEDARLYLEDGEDLGIARDTEKWVAWMVEVIKESVRVCKGVVAYVVGSGKGARRWTGAPALLCADLIRAGHCLRSPVWYKRYGIPGTGTTDWLRADLEWIVCITKNNDELPWSDNTACGHTPKYGVGGAMSCRKKDGTRVDGSPIELRKYTKANPGNIIDCGAVGGGHMGSVLAHDNEAPYPEKIPDFFIRSFCSPGGIVMDPFSGSGTTLAVAVQTGRRFIAIDLRESQIVLTRKRLKAARCKVGFGIL